MKPILVALSLLFAVYCYAEPPMISGRAFKEQLNEPPPCFVAAAATNVADMARISPVIYCVWERYEAGSLKCRLSGYDLVNGNFTEKLPHGEDSIEAGESCSKGGIAKLMNMKVMGRTAREMILSNAKVYYSGGSDYLSQFTGKPDSQLGSADNPNPLPPPPQSGPVMKADGPTKDKGFTSVKVFFATDRKYDGGSFNDNRNETDGLDFGVAEVGIPFGHQLANIESPSIFHLEFYEESSRHVMVRTVTKQDLSTFEHELREKVSASPEKDAFVFIHGYNNTFNDSLRRAAQITYDLNFQGAPIVYSWPSGDATYKYSMAEANVDWTFRHLAKFLGSLPKVTGAKKIHLIAHSMGNRVLTNALMQLMQNDQTRHFNQIILAAPDIDAEVFGQIAAQMQHAGERVTIYASKNDEALQASQKFHAYARLGQGGEQVYATSFSDTVDTSTLKSDLMGHSYFGDDPMVLTDIGMLMLKGLAPAYRPPLIEATQKKFVYWKFDASTTPPANFRDRFYFSEPGRGIKSTVSGGLF